MPANYLTNPFRPGAGHMPPYLAGREKETQEFRKALKQDVILENLVITGLRGVGKTVLLETFKPIAIQENWLWAQNDISEAVSMTEEKLALRLITDLSLVTSNMTVALNVPSVGFARKAKTQTIKIDHRYLMGIFDATPGMTSDKLKAVLEFAWSCLAQTGKRGLIFAYDEAQNLDDHSEKDAYPLSLLLDVFQSIQKKGIPIMLVLTGLPTLFPKLVEARTFAERMFHVVTLNKLTKQESRDAIRKPTEDCQHPLKMERLEVERIVEISGGYPYFIQFIGREAYDVVLQKVNAESMVNRRYEIPFDDIIRKLDNDFFAGRWAKATDRQRDLLLVIAHLPNCDREFSVQEVVERSKSGLASPFGSSHANQMLAKLGELGLVYKNRHGKYSFAVPMFGSFILRQEASTTPTPRRQRKSRG